MEARMASIRIRLSDREAASIRIALKSRIRRQEERIKDSYLDREFERELLAHLTQTYRRLEKANYGKKA
jgi:hypothetical protein